MAHRGSQTPGQRANHIIQEQIELKDWSWNDNNRRTRENVDEMLDKDGNIWGPDDWPDLMHQHFVVLYKVPEVEIMAEKRELESVLHAAMKHGGHARAGTSTRCLGNVAGIHRKKLQTRGYDEQLVAYVHGSYIPCIGCKEIAATWMGRKSRSARKR